MLEPIDVRFHQLAEVSDAAHVYATYPAIQTVPHAYGRFLLPRIAATASIITACASSSISSSVMSARSLSGTYIRTRSGSSGREPFSGFPVPGATRVHSSHSPDPPSLMAGRPSPLPRKPLAPLDEPRIPPLVVLLGLPALGGKRNRVQHRAINQERGPRHAAVGEPQTHAVSR